MPGCSASSCGLTLNAPYNDLEAVERLFSQRKNTIAAVIIEPIAANMGVVEPVPGFLKGLRDITRRNGALLIIDEVITGFRMHYGAVQQLDGIQADLTTLGKIIGGGLPVAAYGGSAELMNHVAPLRTVIRRERWLEILWRCGPELQHSNNLIGQDCTKRWRNLADWLMGFARN